MTETRKEIARLTFCGERFDDHGLDIEILSELIAYKRLLVDTAVELWRRNHPDRERLPKGFEDSIQLKLYAIEPGSTTVPIYRTVRTDSTQTELTFDESDDEVDTAALLIQETIAAAGEGRSLPASLPSNVIPLFAHVGKSLRTDESIVFAHSRYPHPTVHTPKIREQLEHWQERFYEDTVELTGEVRATDLDGRTFTLRLENGTKVKGEFEPSQEDMITGALLEHGTRRLKVVGSAEYTMSDGAIRKFNRIERIDLLPVSYSDVEKDSRPIWDIVCEQGAEVPKEEWDRVPSDLAINYRHYLYGTPKVK